jgi:hypothetical protein
MAEKIKKQVPQKMLITTDDLAAAEEGQFFHGHYYRNNYRKMVKINIILSLIAISLVISVLTQRVFRGFPDYYTSSTDGTLQKITPLNPPTSFLNNIFG